MPKISIISGIYNCADTLEEAIESILNQTVSDWEWILCDDGSSDDTCQTALKYAERFPGKFVVLQNEKNRGLNYTLNKCLREANGEYIARMDGDDRCHPERFAREIAVLEQRQDVDIVSCNMAFFDESGTWGLIEHPQEPSARDFLHGSPFCHAPCMVRKSAFDLVQGYSEAQRLLRVEDYHLWMKMYAAGMKGYNIHETLYEMRDDRNAYARRKYRYRINEAYVRALAVRMLKLPVYGYIYALRPILVGLMPGFLYDLAHKRRLRKKECA